ncbi:MAG: amino acid adenylation domain-containing protein [Gammaproteobacteria bacterium]|nr:amino acid adenylation domain-containing protein [Gammaproteobacteria bacterium]
MTSKTNMLSPEGKCFTFDQRADGFVLGEGVGVLVLKRLEEAIQDGDKIHGLICGWGVNQDGKTNGITAPSVLSQAMLEKNIYEKFKINPEDISFLEVHGTATKFGDSIEVEALQKCFKTFTKKKNFCALGSVKSNIGHTLTASGMAGVMKILLSMQHKELPPTINFEKLNEQINLDDSPFYINTVLHPWESLNNQPRRAAISSFGFSGTNAHVVLEEYVPINERQAVDHIINPMMIILSAKNEKRLQDYVSELLAFVENSVTKVRLEDLAYTLQIGREAMAHRLGILVHSFDELIEKLRAYLDIQNKKFIEGLYTGQVKENQDTLALFDADDMAKTIESWIEQHKYSKLLNLWAKGYNVDWQMLYKDLTPEQKPRKTSAPTYPFAREQYWVETVSSSKVTSVANKIKSNDVREVRHEAWEFTLSNDPVESSHHDINVQKKANLFLQQLIADELQKSLEEIPLDKNYLELGLNSIGLMRVTQKIQTFIDPDFKPILFFEYTCISDLATYLAQYHAAAFERLIAVKKERIFQVPEVTESISVAIAKENTESTTQQSQIFSLSEGQKGLWLLQKITPSMSAYNVPLALRFHEHLDVNALQQAMLWLVSQHSVLQAQFSEDEQGILHQTIQHDRPINLVIHHLDEVNDNELIACLEKHAKQPFNLQQDVLIRFDLWTSSKQQENILLIVVHHIVFDGMSTLILMRDLLQAYRAYEKHQIPKMNTDVASYANFVAWEIEMLTGENVVKHADYWQKQLAGELPILDMPTDKPRSDQLTYANKTLTTRLSAELTHALQTFANEKGVSLFMLLLSIYNVLLARYTHQTDLVIGTPFIGRPEKRFEETVGYFINMVPLRTQLNLSQSFNDYLLTVRQVVAEGLEHAVYPFSKMVADSKLIQDPAYSPIFQTTFVFQNFITQQMMEALLNETIELIPEITQEGGFDIAMDIYEEKNGLMLILSYNPLLFNQDRMERFVGYYQQLAQEIVEDPQKKLENYSFLSQQEKQTLLTDWNKTQRDFPQGACLHQLFEQQAERTPNNIALRYGTNQLTYRELNEKANRLAHYLIKQGVKPGTLVAICMERSLDLIVGMLGILKAGGAYVPLDSAYPKDRLMYILQDTHTPILLTHQSLKEIFQINENIKIICLDQYWKVINKEISIPLKIELSPNQLAYVIYTSGSTGKPKGTLLEHQGLCNLVEWYKTELQITEKDHASQFASPAFDTFGCEVWPFLSVGACVSMIDEKVRYSPEELKQWLIDHQITIADLPTVLTDTLLQITWPKEIPLRILKMGGEKMTRYPMGHFPFKIINSYGPTEATIECMAAEIDSGNRDIDQIISSIGKPIINTCAYVLDPMLELVPIGVSGELYIGGVGLARGYLHNEDLTQKVFIQSPFGEGRLYKTGDCVRWLADGNLEYIARMDEQVKIRGFRIELGEIEICLKQHPAVQNAVVITSERNGEKYLAAYFTLRFGTMITVNKLREHVKGKLPHYMVPSVFTELEAIPLTTNGKVDYKKLPKPREYGVSIKDQPFSEIEKKLLAIWCDILKINNISLDVSFFDVGGHSLSAVRLLAAINKQFACDLSLDLFFKYQTIKEQADYIQSGNKKIQIANDNVIIPLNQNTQGHPLFCIHPVGGHVMCYRALADTLKEDCAVYGIQSPEMDDGAVPYSDIESLSHFYLKKVKEIQPNGPYAFLGWSTGGLIAFEMANQATLNGDSVDKLIILDTYDSALTTKINNDVLLSLLLEMVLNNSDLHTSSWRMNLISYLLKYLKPLQNHPSLLLQLLGLKKIGLSSDRIKTDIEKIKHDLFSLDPLSFPIEEWIDIGKKIGLVSPDIDDKQLMRFYHVFRDNFYMAEHYSPKYYNGNVIFVTASDHSSNHWAEHCRSLKMVIAPANHYNIIKNKPSLNVISQIVTKGTL